MRQLLVHAEIHGLIGRDRELRELLQEHAERLAATPGNLAANAYEPLGGAPRGIRPRRLVARRTRAADSFPDAGVLRLRAADRRDSSPVPSDVTIHEIERQYRPAGDTSLDPSRQD